MEYQETVKIDFKTPENAVIACRSLSASEELKPDESLSTYSSEGNFLVISVKAVSEKALKKAIRTTMPSVKLIEDLINEFALD